MSPDDWWVNNNKGKGASLSVPSMDVLTRYSTIEVFHRWARSRSLTGSVAFPRVRTCTASVCAAELILWLARVSSGIGLLSLLLEAWGCEHHGSPHVDWHPARSIYHLPTCRLLRAKSCCDCACACACACADVVRL